MHHCFKKQLFGYRKKQVDEAISALEKNLDEIGARYEQRIAEVVEENVRVSVELKVARAGYQDAAEMMYSAQSRIRDLEKLLYEERERSQSWKNPGGEKRKIQAGYGTDDPRDETAAGRLEPGNREDGPGAGRRWAR